MKFRTLFSVWGPKSICAAALLLSACGNEAAVRKADEEYQRALALNDLAGQRIALLALTRADDDVSEYWLRLAQVELQMGAFGEAYGHLARAHELDRTAVAPLSMMTELAVINDRLDLAEDHVKKLTVIAPNDRAVAVARGFAAVRESNFEKAQENADILLAQGPRDPVANVLQTKILVAQRKFPEAVDLLTRKLALGADDRAMLRSLAAIYRYLEDWEKAVATGVRLWRLSPSDASLARQIVSGALRARNEALAGRVTDRVMSSSKSREEIDAVLSVWVDLAPNSYPQLGTDPARLPDHGKIAFAHYLNRIGRADQALAVLGGKARPLKERANADFNAVFAEALFLKGQSRPARQILDHLLAEEPDDAVALSARAQLLSSVGDHRAATIDGQRLVTSYATIADYRLLLAKIYRANRDARGADRTLWDAYRDLSGDEKLYKEVQKVLAARGDQEGLARLKSDYDEQRYSRLMKELAL